MPTTHELFLRVKDADEADFNKALVRLHRTNKPLGMKWGDSIDISLDKKNWVPCKIEPAGETGIGRIYIGIHIRELLNRHAFGFHIAKLNDPCSFYIRKAIPWKAICCILIVAVAAIILSLLYTFDLL